MSVRIAASLFGAALRHRRTMRQAKMTIGRETMPLSQRTIVSITFTFTR